MAHFRMLVVAQGMSSKVCHIVVPTPRQCKLVQLVVHRVANCDLNCMLKGYAYFVVVQSRVLVVAGVTTPASHMFTHTVR